MPLEAGKVEGGTLLRVTRVEVAVGDIVDGCRRVNVPMQGRVVHGMTTVSVSHVQIWYGGRARVRVSVSGWVSVRGQAIARVSS